MSSPRVNPRLLLVALGTRGDVQPAVALGVGLREAGYAVTLLAGDDFGDWVRGHELGFAPAGVDMRALMQSPEGIAWAHARSSFDELRRMRAVFGRLGRDTARAIMAAAEDADAILGSFTADAYATSIAEKLGMPYLTTALQPLHPTRSAAATSQPVLAGRESVFNLWSGRLTERILYGIFEQPLNAWRRELGMVPLGRRAYLDRLHAVPTLCGFSAHVVPPPPDWPAHKIVTGYWFLNDDAAWEPSPRLAAFLAAGPPPVYVGFGSMSDPDGRATGELIRRAVHRAGIRAVVAGGWAELEVGAGRNDDDDDAIFALPFAPHGWLFPRMAAVVHHGGAGTTAAAFRAGVPQLVIPHFADQPYWGRRTHELGVGVRPILRRRLSERKLATGLRGLVDDAALSTCAADLGVRVRAEDGVGRAVGGVGEWLGSGA